jgi:NitT/TauT family transport system substrate-binding protein
MVKYIVGIVLVVLIFVGLVFVLHKDVAREGDLQKITIAEFGEVFLYAPLYVADAAGFFEEEGLDVTIVPTGGDEKTFAALLSGDAQFGVADPVFVAISGERGQEGRVVASILGTVPFWGVTRNAAIDEIKEPSALSGYSVATFPAPSTAYALQKDMFLDGGVAPNIREAAFGTLLAVMDAGDADIALELEPNVSMAVADGAKVVYSLADYYPEFAFTGLTVLPEYAEEHPDTVQAAVNALAKALEFIHENQEETARILAERFPEIDDAVAEDAVRNLVAAEVFSQSTLVTQEEWDAAVALRTEVGDITKPAPYTQYVITKFAENAK